jgi:hypothetical protein
MIQPGCGTRHVGIIPMAVQRSCRERHVSCGTFPAKTYVPMHCLLSWLIRHPSSVRKEARSEMLGEASPGSLLFVLEMPPDVGVNL